MLTGSSVELNGMESLRFLRALPVEFALGEALMTSTVSGSFVKLIGPRGISGALPSLSVMCANVRVQSRVVGRLVAGWRMSAGPSPLMSEKAGINWFPEEIGRAHV